MPDIERLGNDFHKDMLRILDREHEIGLCSTRFRQMVERYGGLETAHRLLKTNPEPMFQFFRDKKRLDLCLENYVLMEKYTPLFSDSERDIAKWRITVGP